MKGFVGSAVRWIWARWQLFLGQVAIILVVAFMLFYVNGRQFFISHHLSLPQADGSVTREFVSVPVQSDITTIISILASTARVASTLWVVGIDLRCVFLFMERGGVTLEGLRSMTGGSLPGYRQFRKKRNFILFASLQIAILMSAFTSSVVSGSVTWKPAYKFLPGQPIFVPMISTGDLFTGTYTMALLDSVIGYSTSIYSIFYGDATNRDSRSMRRLVPDRVGSLPNGSRVDELRVPYFAVDAFEWIKDPNSTLSPHQLSAATAVNTTGPRVTPWGFIPDGNWGPSERTFPAPHTVSESRIFVKWDGYPTASKCYHNPTIPSDVQHYVATFEYPSCFIFANVTYRAGVAHSRRCEVWGTGVLKDVGDVKDLQLIGDSVTSIALSIVPYVGATLIGNGYATPQPPAFPTVQQQTIETLSRSYQVAWNALNSDGFDQESSVVSVALAAPIASVLMSRVVLWGIIHLILVGLGFMFRQIHTSGRHPWINDPVIAALLVDPTTLTGDPSAWAGEDASYITARLKLEEQDDRKYIVLERDLEKEEYRRLLLDSALAADKGNLEVNAEPSDAGDLPNIRPGASQRTLESGKSSSLELLPMQHQYCETSETAAVIVRR